MPKNGGQRSVGSKDRVETNGQTYTSDCSCCSSFLVEAVGYVTASYETQCVCVCDGNRKSKLEAGVMLLERRRNIGLISEFIYREISISHEISR